MKKRTRKPAGFQEFDKLMRPLLGVPPDEARAEEARAAKKRAAAKRRTRKKRKK